MRHVSSVKLSSSNRIQYLIIKVYNVSTNIRNEQYIFIPFNFFFSGVLVEHCDLDDSCDLDANSFKGIFVRNLRYLIDEEIANGRAR